MSATLKILNGQENRKRYRQMPKICLRIRFNKKPIHMFGLGTPLHIRQTADRYPPPPPTTFFDLKTYICKTLDNDFL